MNSSFWIVVFFICKILICRFIHLIKIQIPQYLVMFFILCFGDVGGDRNKKCEMLHEARNLALIGERSRQKMSERRGKGIFRRRARVEGG